MGVSLQICLEGLMRNEFSDSPFGLAPVEAYSFRVGMWKSFILLLVTGFAYRVLALLAMKRLAKTIQ